MKVGILGTGKIAHKMAATLSQMNDIKIGAVASRNRERAEDFARHYGINRFYASYEALAKDTAIDLVYIATPHSLHYGHVMLCLEHKKNVLCEKAFMLNSKQAQEVIGLARQTGCLLAEAIWTRYMPSGKMISNILNSGVIGTPSSLTANLGYVLTDIERVIEPGLGGGALLDVGIYPVNFALMAFGEDYDTIISKAVFHSKGADIKNSITMTWEDGKMAVLHSGADALTDRKGVIFGDKGYLEVKNINNCEEIIVFNLDREIVNVYTVPEQISGYEYEIEACREAIEKGWLECPQMPHSSILTVMEILDEIRRQWNYRFPGE